MIPQLNTRIHRVDRVQPLADPAIETSPGDMREANAFLDGNAMREAEGSAGRKTAGWDPVGEGAAAGMAYRGRGEGCAAERSGVGVEGAMGGSGVLVVGGVVSLGDVFFVGGVVVVLPSHRVIVHWSAMAHVRMPWATVARHFGCFDCWWCYLKGLETVGLVAR